MAVPNGPYSTPAIANEQYNMEQVQMGAEEYKYSDDELVSLIHQEVQRSQQDWQTKVAQQREQAIKYYYGEPFGNERPGFSRHVSMEVFEAVEDVKTKILNALTTGGDIVKFQQEMEDDQEGADLATKYVKHIFWRENDGYNVIKDCLHDALVEKQCVVRPYVFEETKITPEQFRDVPYQQVEVMAGDPSVREVLLDEIKDEIKMVPTPMGPQQVSMQLASGKIIRENKIKRVKVDVIEPESVFITVNANDARNADSIVLRFEKTRAQLVGEGFDPEIVDSIGPTSAENTWNYGRYARQSLDDTYTWDRREGEGERSLLEVFEAYIDLDMDADGLAETWKFTIAGNTLLDKEMIAGKNMQFWSPYRIAHKAIGMSIADVTIDLQRTISGIVRGVADNVYLTNTSTKIADLSVIKNPRDLIDNPIGAVIDSSDPDAVKMVPQPQLNPATFGAMDIFKGQAAGRVGLQKIDQRQAISHQNSEDMVADLMAQGEERISEMARSFVECLLKPLFCEIYKLGVEAGLVVGVQSQDGFQKLNPYRWTPERYAMEIKVAITKRDREETAMKLGQMLQTMASDPQLSPLFGVTEKYAMITDMFENMGIASPAYLKNPNSQEGQQALQQAAQQRQKEEQMRMMELQAGNEVAMREIARKQAKDQGDLKLKAEAQHLDALSEGQDHRLDREKFEWDKHEFEKEFSLEKSQNRAVTLG